VDRGNWPPRFVNVVGDGIAGLGRGVPGGRDVRGGSVLRRV
jgi:hypothetical protein